jgi:hypothetical protein
MPNKYKLTISSDILFKIEGKEYLNYSMDCYFQESVRILSILKSFQCIEKEFQILVHNFQMMYKLHYNANREVPIRVGGTTYVSLEEII